MKKKTGIACIIALIALTISAAATFVPTLENETTAKVRVVGRPLPMVNSSKSSADLGIFAARKTTPKKPCTVTPLLAKVKVVSPTPVMAMVKRSAEPEIIARILGPRPRNRYDEPKMIAKVKVVAPTPNRYGQALC